MQIQTMDTKAPIEMADAVMDYPYNEGLIHQAVVAYMNRARSGNSAQKTRAEVRGGGAKPWKQKGSGRARAGSIRSPLWRSGGVTFASKPRDYASKLNKKMYNRAIRSIFSELNRSHHLIVLSDFQVKAPKTKDFLVEAKKHSLKSALFIVDELGINEYLAIRNVPNFMIIDVSLINPVDLLRFEKVVVTEAALKKIEDLLK